MSAFAMFVNVFKGFPGIPVKTTQMNLVNMRDSFQFFVSAGIGFSKPCLGVAQRFLPMLSCLSPSLSGSLASAAALVVDRTQSQACACIGRRGGRQQSDIGISSCSMFICHSKS